MPEIIQLNYGDEKLQSTTQTHNLGDRAQTPDGRNFRYCFADGAVTAGKLVQNPAGVAAHDNDVAVQAAAAVGDTSIKLSIVTTNVTADQYKDGILYINDVDGEGQMFRLATHLAVTAGNTGTFNLAGNEAVKTALTTSSQAGLMKNSWNDVIIAPTVPTGHIVGATCRDVSDNNYFWAQRTGLAALLIDGTVTIGQLVMRSDGTAGAVEAADFAGTVENPIIGEVTLIANATTDYGMINMTLDP